MGHKLRPVKGLILSGGAGTRMRPLTHSNAKQLLPIANKPILHRVISNLVDVGIHDVVIVVGDTAPLVMSSVGNGSQLGANVSYVRQESPLGLAHCVKISQDNLADSDFVMYLGDNMFESDLASVLSDFSSGRQIDGRVAQVAVKSVDNPSSFGVALLDDSGRLVSVEEKPSNPKSDLALVGTYVFTSAIYDAIDATIPSPRGELEITDSIQRLVDGGHLVGVSSIHGWWYDTGNPQSYLACNAATLAMEGTNPPRPPRGVTFVPPCVIHPTALLEDCTIGPNASIGAGAVIVGATVTESAVLRDGVVRGGGRLFQSIVGERSEVVVRDGTTCSVVVGDDCSVEVN